MCFASHCPSATVWSTGSLVYFRDGACILRAEGIGILRGFISGDSGSPLGTIRNSHRVNTCLTNVCLCPNGSCNVLVSGRDFWVDANFIWLDTLTHRRIFLSVTRTYMVIDREKEEHIRKHKVWEKPLRSIITLHPQSLGLSVCHTRRSHSGAPGRGTISLRSAWTIRKTLSQKQQASFYFQIRKKKKLPEIKEFNMSNACWLLIHKFKCFAKTFPFWWLVTYFVSSCLSCVYFSTEDARSFELCKRYTFSAPLSALEDVLSSVWIELYIKRASRRSFAHYI